MFARRYKYIVTASIGSMPPTDFASVLVASKCLWNSVTDKHSTANYVDDQETFYAVVVVFAVYLE